MANQHLNITIIQPDIVWEDKTANLNHYEQLINSITDTKHVVVLPEMFNTGFSMAPETFAESMDGAGVSWMAAMAVKHRCIITGSLMIAENGRYYNRMIWVQPDGRIGTYDKRHLFAYGNEDKHYTAGDRRTIVSVNGWRINLMVCYDLRFPVWARNKNTEYDVLLYVANWPQQRSLAWKTLLQARAIENMSYVVGVNRVGTDGKGLSYSGDSSVFGPLGETLCQLPAAELVQTVTLDKDVLEKARATFPFLKDADNFIIP